MKSQPKTRARRSARRPAADKGLKVRLEFDSKVVHDDVVMGRKRRQSLENAIAYYRGELEGNPDKVFSIYPQDACALLADTVAFYFEVGSFQMVLRYSEDLGWHAHSLLST